LAKLPDVDIDVKDRDGAAALFPFAPASQFNTEEDGLNRHKTGLYPQRIPVDPNTGLAAFPFDYANEPLGYFKIDLLPNHIYDQFESMDHMRETLRERINWNWFMDERFYMEGTPIDEPLTHIGGHFDTVKKYPPESLHDIAILLALIRPAKMYLKGKSIDLIRSKIWLPDPEQGGYVFKLPHAFAFATLVGLHARLIARKL
jgi:hypothetical protein